MHRVLMCAASGFCSQDGADIFDVNKAMAVIAAVAARARTPARARARSRGERCRSSKRGCCQRARTESAARGRSAAEGARAAGCAGTLCRAGAGEARRGAAARARFRATSTKFTFRESLQGLQGREPGLWPNRPRPVAQRAAQHLLTDERARARASEAAALARGRPRAGGARRFTGARRARRRRRGARRGCRRRRHARHRGLRHRRRSRGCRRPPPPP